MPPQSKRQKRGEKRTTSGTRKSQRASVKRAISTVNDKDWREGKTLSESMLTMFTDEISCDVHFLCGEDEVKVGAHKFILLCRSSVFYAMFEGPAGNQDSEVKIPDITADIFRSFLRYMYSDKAEFTEGNLMEMLYVGKKYQVHSLIDEGNVYIRTILTVDTACTLLETSHTFSEPALHHTVLAFIEDNLEDICSSQTYKELCRECLGEILDLNEVWFGDSDDEEEEEEEPDYDRSRSRSWNRSRSRSRSRSWNRSRSRSRSRSLERGAREEADDDPQDRHNRDESLVDHPDASVNLERQLFNMLLSWTDCECEKQNLEKTGENRRVIAGDLITKIRYGFLNSDFVIGRVSESGILSMEQECKLMRYLLRSQKEENIFWNVENRALHSLAVFFPRFERKSESEYFVCNGVEAISFRCFEDLYLHGFTLYKRAFEGHNSDEYDVHASITDESGQVLSSIDLRYDDVWRAKDETVTASSNSRIVFRKKCTKTIWLNSKILVKKNCKYNILADIYGPDSYCGKFYPSSRGQNEVSFPILHRPKGNIERKIAEIVDYKDGSDDTPYEWTTNVYRGQIADLVLSVLQ